MIDAHAHMVFEGLEEKADEVLKDARDRMKAVITCGLPRDWEETLKLAEKHPDFLYVTLGIHPNDVSKMTDEEIDEFIEVIRENKDKIVGIGEIGLDAHHEDVHERMIDTYKRLLDLSLELDLPVVIHSRKAEQECLDILNEMDYPEGRAAFHCYTGNMTVAKAIRDSGYLISISTVFPKSKNPKKILERFPLDILFTETDAPFLHPEGEWPNTPQMVESILDYASENREESREEIENQIDENIKSFYNI